MPKIIAATQQRGNQIKFQFIGAIARRPSGRRAAPEFARRRNGLHPIIAGA
jgi:hypothetical protein